MPWRPGRTQRRRPAAAQFKPKWPGRPGRTQRRRPAAAQFKPKYLAGRDARSVPGPPQRSTTEAPERALRGLFICGVVVDPGIDFAFFPSQVLAEYREDVYRVALPSSPPGLTAPVVTIP